MVNCYYLITWLNVAKYIRDEKIKEIFRAIPAIVQLYGLIWTRRVKAFMWLELQQDKEASLNKHSATVE